MALTTRDLKNTKSIAPFNHEGHAEGTTTNDYVNALDLDCIGMHRKTIILKNTHAANVLKYKLLISAFLHGGLQEEEVAETTLAGVTSAVFKYRQGYARMILQVKSSVTDTHATYTADYTMSGI